MTEYKEVIFNVTDGTVTERPYTEKEIAEVKKAEEELELKIKQKQETRQSALAKLAALGLTEEEIAAL